MRRIIILIFALSVLSNLTYASFSLKGDVTGDGRVNGKDVLKIMMIIEGEIARPSQDDPFWDAADVYPIPGEGGRVVGDGKITKDDAYRILTYTVGLISLGELTGEMEGPLIVSFDPISGPPGTKVTLKGLNFVPGSKTENVVRLSGLNCPIISAFSTELVFEIPAGAESGPFTVITSGGTATSLECFTVTQSVPGKLDLGEGANLSPSDFTILSSYDEAVPDSSGNFSLELGDDMGHIVVAVPKDRGENFYFSIYSPSGSSEGVIGERDEGIKVNAFTTAVSLIYMNPAVLPRDNFPREKLLETIRSLPETKTLASVIGEIYPSNRHPLDDPRVKEALKNAISALAGKLPEIEVLDPAQVKASQEGSQAADSGGEINRMDVKALSVKLRSKGDGKTAFSVSNNFFTPVDWFVRVERLDPKEFPGGIEDIRTAKADRVYRRLKTVKRGMVAARGFFNITSLLADLAHGMIEVLSIPIGASALISADTDLDNGIYVMRAFSGVCLFTDIKEQTFIDETLPKGGQDSMIAYCMNMAGLIADLIAAVAGPMPEKLKHRVMISIGAAVVKKLAQVGLIDLRKSAITAGAVFAGGLTLAILWDTLKDILNDTFNTVIQAISEEASELANLAWVKKFAALAGTITKTFNVAAKFLSFGRVVDRATAMVTGYPSSSILRLLGVSVPKVTPLESALILVGTPVKILEYPKEVIPGDIYGVLAECVSDKKEENHVFFGGVEAEVTRVIVKTTNEETDEPERVKLLVKVPPLAPGTVPLALKAPKGSDSADGIKVIRKPFIDGITPSAGFAAGGTFKGYKFGGTEVHLKGNFFDPDLDEVYFGDVKAEVNRRDSKSYLLIVRVPDGAKTGKIRVKTSLTESESPVEFRVIDSPPQLKDISPKELHGSEIVKINCANLPPYSEGFNVIFDDKTGSPEYGKILRVSGDYAWVSAPLYLDPERQVFVTVETPAGKSDAIEVKPLKGRATGTEIGVWEHKNILKLNFEIKADGDLSFGEALKIAAGKLDPFQPPYDDTDTDVVFVQKDFYKRDGEDLKFLRTEFSLESVTPRNDRGHPNAKDWGGDEKAYVTVKRFKVIEGEGTTPLPSNSFSDSMDGPISYSLLQKFADEIKGLGKREEGDYFYNYNFGKNFADSIMIDRADMTCNGNIILAGGDSIRFYCSTVVVNGDVIIETDDNYLWVENWDYEAEAERGKGVMVNGKLRITGNRNVVASEFASKTERIHLFQVAKGIFISGCYNNVVVSVGGDEKLDRGILITDGARGNKIACPWKTLVRIQNCHIGIELSNGAQSNDIDIPYIIFEDIDWDGDGEIDETVEKHLDNIVNCDIGLQITGNETKYNSVILRAKADTGAIISDGASYNNISVESKGKVGVVVEGGARGNIVGSLYNSQDIGVIVRGKGTDQNIIKARRADEEEGNVTGIKVIGDSNGSPMATIIENSYLGGDFMLLENLQGQTSPPVTVRYSSARIILDNIKGALLEKILWGSLLIKGEKSTDNLIRLSRLYTIHLTDKASNNRFENIELEKSYGTEYGILIDGKASNNTFTMVDGLRAKLNSMEFSGGSIGVFKIGVMIRGGAKNNIIDGYKFVPYSSSSITDDIVIAEAGTADNSITRCDLHSIIVKDGAVGTIIGSPILGKGNLLRGSQDHPTITIQGTNTRGTRIMGNDIRGEKGGDGMILVDSAEDIDIGNGEPNGGNTLSLNVDLPAAIHIKNAKKVRIRNNKFSLSGNFKGDGISVEGNQTSDVMIGGPTEGEGNDIKGAVNGIHLSNIPSGAVGISRNKLSLNGRGILLDQSPGVYITDNTVLKSSSEGIKLIGDKTAGVKIERNIVVDGGGNGISLATGVHGVLMSDNMVARNKGFGINLGGVKNIILSGSIFGNSAGGINSLDPSPPKVSHVGRRSIVGDVPQGVSDGSLVQVYADGKDQGRLFLGQTQVHGKAWRLKVTPPSGMNITATVTEPDKGTSSFGQVGEPADRPPVWGDQLLAFTSTREGNGEIYLYVPASARTTRLTESEGISEHSPAISPDGSMIAFVLEVNDNSDIWIVRTDGTNPIRFTSHKAADYDPCWSPDGKRLAFVSERDGNPEIYSMSLDPDNPDLKRLTDNPGVDRHPSWSSKGRIAFTSDRSGSKDIWVMDADGGNKICLTNSNSPEYDPAWSPDGSRIAFVGEKDGNPEIYLMNEDGSNVIRLTSDPSADVQPTWSPNGMWVGFASGRLGDMEIFAKEVSGGRLERITVSLGINAEPSWGLGVVIQP